MKVLFASSELSVLHTTIGAELVKKIYINFMENVASKVRILQVEESLPFSVYQMSEEGQSKVRNVGAWAVRKVLEQSRDYVKTNMYTTSQETSSKVKMYHTKCNLLDDNIIIPYSALQENTQYPDTLQVTENRQYRERGLLHISDSAFEFFFMLEQQRIQKINLCKLRQLKEHSISKAFEEIKKDDSLLLKWQLRKEYEVLIKELFQSIVLRYINMAGSQFLRDFRLAHRLKKSSELRKKILQKQEREVQKKDCVLFKEIQQDNSQGKVDSHGCLSNFIKNHKATGLVKCYKKDELKSLCDAYRVKYTSD
ncbi:hypothetical protein AC249_AIPGENE8699 [Exaiptasia diaphana]|nr:hypothetical protein AC249_AIPGENE8699 [Exaiptasia diaphana]